MARVHNIESWVERYRGLLPVTSISVATARFDTQKLQNPEINGVEYQRGELWGYEVKEYLLEKWGRKCAYCGKGIKEKIPVEISHIIPPSKGGTDRVSNLTLACTRCNQKKGGKTAAEFGYPEIQKRARTPLRDAAIVTATRWRIYNTLCELGLPVEMGTGGRTKYNRDRLGIPKSHCFDAVCVGALTPDFVFGLETCDPLSIKTIGRGQYKRTTTDKYGFPRGTRTRNKFIEGFKSGDMVRATVIDGKNAGVHIGYVTVRENRSFSVERDGKRIVGGASVRRHKFELLQRADGFRYSLAPPSVEEPDGEDKH